MVVVNAQQREVIRRCQLSMAWFLRNLGKVKHPSAGIIPFFPFKYQLKAIKSFRKHRLNIFRKCFAAGSMVWTPTGPKPIEAVKKGDEVYSYDQRTGAVVIGKVTAAWCNGERDIVTVRTKTGHRSDCTPDHSFLTRRRWMEAKDFTPNDVLVEVHEPQRYLDADESEAIIIGYLVTDGCYSGSGSGHQFHFTNTCRKYLLEYQRHFQKRFAKRLRIKLHNKAGSGKSKKDLYRVLSSDTAARKWLKSIGMWGHKAENKRLPECVFSWNNASLAVLLNRIFAGGGWYSGKHCNEVGLRSESALLLHQVKQLLSRFGIDAKFYPATDNSLAKLRIFGTDNFSRFVDQIGIYGKEPRYTPTTKGFFRKRVKGQVKSVKPAGKALVYDLEVDKYNFIVDGVVAHNCRQAGISKIAGAFALWFAMFHPHKTILIVSRTDNDAMNFLREQIVFLFEHLPPWMQELWKPVKNNEHELFFPNGSKIKSLTSHPDVLRSNASSLNIIDEAAFIPSMDIMWAGGWPCTRYNTLIQTAEGLVKVGDLARGGDPWKDHSISVATDNGYQYSDKAYVSGRKPTTIVDTSLGFQIEGTHHHRLRVIDEVGNYVWRELGDISPGDILVSLPGQFVGKRQYLDNGIELSPDLAEILGLYIGDGSLSRSRPKRFKIVFDPQDAATRDAVIAKFNGLPLGLTTTAYAETEFDTENLRLNSAEFCELLVRNGLASKSKPQNAQIPQMILKSDTKVLCAFLRGLFDSDGWCYQSSTGLKLGLSTTSELLAEQVQIALHALGIISRRCLVEPAKVPDRNEQRYGGEPYWRVDIWDAASKLKYRDLIGFITDRKQAALDAFCGSNEFAEIDHPVLVYEFATAVLKKLIAGGTFRQCPDARKWNLHRIRRSGVVRLALVRELANEFGLTDRLSSYIQRGFFFDTVAAVKSGETETFDISVPHNNTYLANGMVSHNTLQHGGNVIVISTCVAGDSLVWTNKGMCRIGDFDGDYVGEEGGYEYKLYVGPAVFGRRGLQQPSAFYKRRAEETRRITSKMGYELEAHTKHRVWLCREGEMAGWTYADQIRPGDFIPIKRGMMQFGDDDDLNFSDGPGTHASSSFNVGKIDDELAAMVGLIVAEGYINDDYVTVTSDDRETHDWLTSNRWGLVWMPESRSAHISCYNRCFVRFLRWLGCVPGTAPDKEIPRRLWSCSKGIIAAFLRGLYDGDGHSRSRNGEVGYTSTSRQLIKQVRAILLNFGIITREEYHPAHTKTFDLNGRSYMSDCRESWQLIVPSGEIDKFYDLIGFGLDRKTANSNKTLSRREFVPNVRFWLARLRQESGLSIGELKRRGINTPNLLFKKRAKDLTERSVLRKLVDVLAPDHNTYLSFKALQSLTDESIFWDEVKNVDVSSAETYDFTIPGDHTFISNGFVSHNTNGVGNWYWSTVTDAEAGVNQFNPCIINWWDMDWAIEYVDPLSKENRRIAPCDGILEAKGQIIQHPKHGPIRLDPVKYGQWWSPWLEDQYRALQEQGEAWKFEQEVLAQFVGSGNTVLSKEVLAHVQTTLKEPKYKVEGLQVYVHPVTGSTEELDFSFRDPNEGLWVWEKPVLATPMKKRGNTIIDPGTPAHSYVMGVDIATGKGRDYSAIEVFDVITRQQVAEFMAHCLPREFVKFIDRIGRWYNCALAVIERNNGGDTLIDMLRHDIMYPRIWRKKDINDKPRPMWSGQRARPLKVAPYGFLTTTASKPTLNKFLIDCIRDNEEDGYTVFSKRLLKQFQTYVRKRDRSGKDTMKTEAEDGAGNFDDLVMACGMALVGAADAYIIDAGNLVPMGPNGGDFKSQTGPKILSDTSRVDLQETFAARGGPGLLMPMTLAPTELPETSAQRQLDAYTLSLGSIPISQGKPLVTPKRFFYDKD